MEGPSEVVRAFSAALRARDFDAVEALCTREGWESGGESVGRLVRQARRRRWDFVPLAELVEGDARAAVCGLLSDSTTQRQYGRLWLHAIRDGEWRLEGVTKSDKASALFVSGVIPAIFAPERLPESPAAEAWAKSLLSDTTSQAKAPLVEEGLECLSHDVTGVLDLVAAYQIALLGRHAVGIGRRHGPDDLRQSVWFALEEDETQQLQVIGHAPSPNAALLMETPAG